MVSINILNDQHSTSKCIIIYEGLTVGVCINTYIYKSQSCSVGLLLFEFEYCQAEDYSATYQVLDVCMFLVKGFLDALYQVSTHRKGGDAKWKLGKLEDLVVFTLLCMCLLKMSRGQVPPPSSHV